MDQEWYVAFVGPRAWRDLTEDNPTTNVLTLANRDARVRGVDNPLFTGDSLVWDGMILRQIPEINPLKPISVRAAFAIEPVYLCGAQAIGSPGRSAPRAPRTPTTTASCTGSGSRRSAGSKNCGSELRGADQTTPKDHGIVTGFFAAASD
jgi:hypothetical protein